MSSPATSSSSTSNSNSLEIVFDDIAIAGPIIYNEENPDIPRDHYHNFFTTCSNMLNEQKYVESIVNQSLKTNSDLSKVSVNFQTDVMEKMFQIEKKFGCSYMVRIPHIYPSDALMINAVKDFTYATVKCYYNALKFRFKKSGSKLRNTGGMTKVNFNEFFEGCNALSKSI